MLASNIIVATFITTLIGSGGNAGNFLERIFFN